MFHTIFFYELIYFITLISYIKGSYDFTDQTLSQCATANLTKHMLQKTLTNLSNVVNNEFVHFSTNFINEIEDEISNIIANVQFSKQNVLSNTVNKKKYTTQEENFHIPNFGYKNEIQIIFDFYVDNILNLFNSFRQNFELLHKNVAELKIDIRKINTTIRNIEHCVGPNTFTEDANVTKEDIHKRLPMDCYESRYKKRNNKNGLTVIQPNIELPPQEVWCNNSFEGGGWTVILRRAPQKYQLDFRRKFSEYEEGFGNSEAEYWIGLKSLHYLTSFTQNELYVQLEIPDENAFARYNNFRVGDPNGYNLHVSEYNESSSGGNSLIYHNRMPFSTYDKDRDLDPDRSCSALAGGGGFWFNFCYHANPTGIYPPDGLPKDTALHSMIEWRRWKGFHTFLTHFTMMIRPAKSNRKLYFV